VSPTRLLFGGSDGRQGIIPLVMLHHLAYGGLTIAAFLLPVTGGSS